MKRHSERVCYVVFYWSSIFSQVSSFLIELVTFVVCGSLERVLTSFNPLYQSQLSLPFFPSWAQKERGGRERLLSERKHLYLAAMCSCALRLVPLPHHNTLVWQKNMQRPHPWGDRSRRAHLPWWLAPVELRISVACLHIGMLLAKGRCLLVNYKSLLLIEINSASNFWLHVMQQGHVLGPSDQIKQTDPILACYWKDRH